MQSTKWTNCYEDGWKDIIVPEAFAHPAKMSYSLLKRILAHIKEEGWTKAGGKVTIDENILAEIKKDIDKHQFQRIE